MRALEESWTEIARTEAAARASWVMDGRLLVETPSGPVPATTLEAGDLVTTFDDGPKRLRAVERHRSSEIGRMILVPAGLVGNEADMLLAPDQQMIVESDAAEAVTGSPFAVIPAAALEAAEGVRRARAARARGLVSLVFAEAQAVTVCGGAVLVTAAAAGMPCLLRGRTDRYAPLDPVLVPKVVEALEEASWGPRYAAMA